MSVDIPMLEVLLKRMETHPEEFVDDIDSRKWGGILEKYSDCLTQPERDKIAQGIRNARRQMLNQKIMQRLVGEGEPSTYETFEVGYTHFDTSNRAMWGTTSISNIATNVAEDSIKNLVVERMKELDEERELKAMHDYYKKIGQAE